MFYDHLSREYSIQNMSKYTAYAMTALCDNQVMAVRLCWHPYDVDILISNGQQSIKSNIFGHSPTEASNYLLLGSGGDHMHQKPVADSWYIQQVIGWQ